MFDDKRANIFIFVFIVLFVGGILIFLNFRHQPIKDISTGASISPTPKPKEIKVASISAVLTMEASLSAKPSSASAKKK